MSQANNKIRYSSIVSDGILTSKPQTNSNSYELDLSRSNYLDILCWCTKLDLFSFNKKFIAEINNNLRMDYKEKFKLIMKTIGDNMKRISKTKLKVFENVVRNLQLLDNPILSEYTDPLPYYDHLMVDKIVIEKTNCSTQTNSAVPTYPMCSKNRGVLFFVNMIHFPLSVKKTRAGAEYDKIYMIRLFREYGYTIYYYEDLLADTFCKLLNRLIYQSLDDFESLVLVLATHGDESNDAQFYYDQTLNINDIVYKFNDANCSAMRGKPKILLFPFCRGAARDFGTERCYSTIQMDGGSNLQPTFSDVLIGYATVHGYASIRDDNYGTWYVEAFCKVLAQYGHKHDIESMLYMLVVEINQMNDKHNKIRLIKGQRANFLTPSFVRRDFNKLLFFNPGYVENKMDENY